MSNPDEAPSITDVFMAFVEDLQAHALRYLLAGTGIAVVSVPLMVTVIGGSYALVLGVIFGGIALDDPDAIVLGSVAATFASLALIAVASLVVVPLQASLLRAIDRHFAASGVDSELGFGSAWESPTQDLGTILLFSTTQAVVAGTGLMLFYLPGLLFIALTDLAWPHLVLERQGIGAAYRFSFESARTHTSWHLGYVVLLFSLSMILPYIPILGLFVTASVLAAWRVIAFRALVPRT